MIPNIKSWFNKKVTFLALVPVLQWNSYPSFLTYVCSKWKVTYIFNLQEWHQNIHNCKSLFKQILPWCFIRRPPAKTTTFKWSQEWSSYAGSTVIQISAVHNFYWGWCWPWVEGEKIISLEIFHAFLRLCVDKIFSKI